MIKWLKRLFNKGDLSEEGGLWEDMLKGCPECGHSPMRLNEGPAGGACINVFCADCGQGYNIAPAIRWAEKIQKDIRYIG